ncbi:MAG TPA: type II toxin-antitoxin system VapB family antitoxin [Acetobacteraceae bacterium]|jgi:antitoxin VapB
MPLYIKDETTTRLVNELARRRGITKQRAVRLAVEAELARGEGAVPLRERLIRLWEANPLPPPTGAEADKAFFDELSGDP